jgi:hypothetical protein
MGNHATNAALRDDLSNALPDIMLPSQFFELVGSARNFSSEQRLLLAVLTDAINVLRVSRVSPNRLHRESFDEASCWIFEDGLSSPLSFDHVCDALGVDAERLRRRLSEMVSDQSGGQLRLRVKQATRRKFMTVNRDRRRRRRTREARGNVAMAPTP